MAKSKNRRNYFGLGGLSLLLSFIMVMVMFINCQNVEEPAVVESSSHCIDVDANKCSEPKEDLLSLIVHSPSSEIFLQPHQSQFNISGDCNEGGFQDHMIAWELYANSSLISSSMEEKQTLKCSQGHFLILVQLPVRRNNQNSLWVGGLRVSHLLVLNIGQTVGGKIVKSPSAQKRLHIHPIP